LHQEPKIMLDGSDQHNSDQVIVLTNLLSKNVNSIVRKSCKQQFFKYKGGEEKGAGGGVGSEEEEEEIYTYQKIIGRDQLLLHEQNFKSKCGE
jgi:hypothetical protein